MSNTIALYAPFLPSLISVVLFRLATRCRTLLSGVSPNRISTSFVLFFASLASATHLTHSTKEAQPEEDPSVSARLQRLQNNYEDFGMRRTVEGVLVVHDHGHPHILMLQIANAFFKLYVLPVFCIFFLSSDVTPSPGDYLKPGEDELDGLKRRLDDRLAPPSDSRQFNASHGIDNDWEIGDCLAQWWRPNFETFMVILISVEHNYPPTCA
jgi:cleavage and polyadenylation specificity factor subunit 5